MLVMKSYKRTVLLILVFLISKSLAEEKVKVSDEGGGQHSADKVPAPDKALDTKTDESENQPSSHEDKNDIDKLDKSDQPSSPVDNNADKNQKSKSEESENQPQATQSKQQQPEKAESSEQQQQVNEKGSEQQQAQNEKGGEEPKVETNSENSPVSADADAKKQNVKLNDNSRKTNLNDVNALTEDKDEALVTPVKREAYSDLLALPRDASYFFDDLEPFINNNSGNNNMGTDSRVGRAIPSKETKIQRTRFTGKKETIDDDLDDEEDETAVDESEEKVNDEEYDDDYDEDSEPDCQPTTPCSSTTPCSTTTPCPTTTTPCPTTTKCSTTPKCTTQCKPTQEKCTTKSTKMCGKATRKKMGNSPLATIEWDADRRRFNNRKRKFQGKIVSGK